MRPILYPEPCEPAPGITSPYSPWWHPPDPVPSVIYTVSWASPLPIPCTWDHTSTVSRVTPLLNLYLVSQVNRLQDDPTIKILYLGSQVYCFQGEPSSQTLHLGSLVESLQGDHHISETVPRVKHPQSLRLAPTPRTCTWGPTSIVSGLPHAQTFNMVSHDLGCQGYPLQDPVMASHIHSFQSVITSQTLHLESHKQRFQGDSLAGPEP